MNGVISVTRGILAGNIKRQVNKDIFIYVATFVDIVWMISTSQHVRPFIYLLAGKFIEYIDYELFDALRGQSANSFEGTSFWPTRSVRVGYSAV